MIESIDFTNLDFKKFNYMKNLPFIKNGLKKIEFTDGLNIITGRNGSGKSSVLSAIAYFMCADEAGFSIFSQIWYDSFISNFNINSDFSKKIVKTIDIKHDGQPIVYANPKRKIGEYEKRNTPDNYSIYGINEMLYSSTESSGEATLRRLSRAFSLLNNPKNFVNEIYFDHELNNRNYVDSVKDIVLTPSIPKGKKTIIFDEPETNLDLLSQIAFWKLLKSKKVQKNYQIIVVSHSMASLNIKGANYIDLTENYYQSCINYSDDSFIPFSNLSDDDYSTLMLINNTRKGYISLNDVVKKNLVNSCENLLNLRMLDTGFLRSSSKKSESAKKDRSKKFGKNNKRKEIYYLTEKAISHLLIFNKNI